MSKIENFDLMLKDYVQGQDINFFDDKIKICRYLNSFDIYKTVDEKGEV